MIGTHKRAGRCCCLLRCLRAFVLFLRAFPFCGVVFCLSPSIFFRLGILLSVCVIFILRSLISTIFHNTHMYTYGAPSLSLYIYIYMFIYIIPRYNIYTGTGTVLYRTGTVPVQYSTALYYTVLCYSTRTLDGA